MNTTILDTITAAFVNALSDGQQALAAYSLPLLGVFAVIAFYVQFAPLLASGGGGAGDAVASVLFITVKMGIFYWILVNLAGMAEAAFLTFLQWGIAPAGGGLSAQTFLSPSTVLDVGFRLGKPLRTFTDSWVGWAAGQAHLAIERVFRYSDRLTLPSEAPCIERRTPHGYACALIVS